MPTEKVNTPKKVGKIGIFRHRRVDESISSAALNCEIAPNVMLSAIEASHKHRSLVELGMTGQKLRTRMTNLVIFTWIINPQLTSNKKTTHLNRKYPAQFCGFLKAVSQTAPLSRQDLSPKIFLLSDSQAPRL